MNFTEFFKLKRRPPSEEAENKVVHMLTEKKSNGKYAYTYRQIAKELKKYGVTKSFVQDTAKRHGLERKGRRH